VPSSAEPGRAAGRPAWGSAAIPNPQPRFVIDTAVVPLTVSALCGLAVGLEREWSGHAAGPLARFAGLRTFFLLGTLGGVGGWLSGNGAPALGASFVAGGVVLTVVAYAIAARPGGRTVDGTTEVAAIVVLAIGALAGLGHLEVASGATAVIVLALSEKDRLRGVVERIDEAELRAALHFAVLALVVLPLLPDATYGPLGGIRPRALWTVVLIFSGLSFAGYIARQAVGASRGYGFTGMLGGLVSSTAVTLQFSRLSRLEPRLTGGLAIGVVGASTVLIPRVLLVSAILNAEVALALLPFLMPPLLAGGLMTAAALARHAEADDPPGPSSTMRSPLQLGSAIRMALALQATLMAMTWIRESLGSGGVLASAALLGLTDVDAITLSMNRMASTPDLVPLATHAIGVALISNALTKLVLALALGGRAFRLAAGWRLGLFASVSILALAMAW
jgi:uncharacterized membrane protein (DUF4010 family)